jgi:hypothetical protein
MRHDRKCPPSPQAATTMRRHGTSVPNDLSRHVEPQHQNDISTAVGGSAPGASPGTPDAQGSRLRRGARARRVSRRLGPVEWGLLAVILLAVGITLAMAIFKPG